ncbi:MAG TPA: response regulator [Candidatus Paceibacterota bacterium]
MDTISSDTKTVLVVEDEQPLADAIRLKLEHSGFAVAVARTVEQALHYLEDLVKVDAIWLDHYLLGKENGLDFVMMVKGEKAEWRHIPIFVVSNTASIDKVHSYLQLGVQKYYVKANYRIDEIVKDITEALATPSA